MISVAVVQKENYTSVRGHKKDMIAIQKEKKSKRSVAFEDPCQDFRVDVTDYDLWLFESRESEWAPGSGVKWLWFLGWVKKKNLYKYRAHE